MSIEDFTEEVSTWERRDVGQELKKLKNCNDLLELLDMFDSDKFELVKEQLGDHFFNKACKRLDSWKHYFKWIAMSPRQEDNDRRGPKHHSEKREHHGEKGENHGEKKEHHRDHKQEGRNLNSVPIDTRPQKVSSIRNSRFAKHFRTGRSLQHGERDQDSKYRNSGPWFPGKAKKGNNNSNFLRKERHMMNKFVRCIRAMYWLTITAFAMFVVFFYKTKKHMTELDFYSTVNTQLESTGMSSDSRNQAWQIMERNLKEKSTKSVITRFVTTIKNQVSYDHGHNTWVNVVPNADLVQVESVADLASVPTHAQPTYTLEQVKSLLIMERSRLAQEL